ncbi:hypothetical protein [Azospirillum endophyticum]
MPALFMTLAVAALAWQVHGMYGALRELVWKNESTDPVEVLSYTDGQEAMNAA